MKLLSIKHAMILGALALINGAFSTAASAATVTMSFDTVARYTGATPIAGTAPWLTLSILDTAPGVVQLTVSTLLPAAGSPPQTLTGIWLNVPAAVTAGLNSLTLTSGTGTGQNPAGFVSGGSEFSTSQSITPAGATAAQVGRYSVWLSFPNSGAGSSFQDHQTETFLLSGTGLSAVAFYALAAQTAGGLPNPSFFGLASLTNAGGTAGSGVAYIGVSSATVSAVPLPGGLLLLGSALLAMRRAAVRRKSY